MVADALDVLGAEQEVGAVGDVARVLHHERQEVAEHGIFEQVEVGVAHPHVAGAVDVAVGVGVQRFLEQEGGGFVHRLQADDGARQARLGGDHQLEC